MSTPQCFYPNGNPSLENDVPCGSGNGVQCCPSGWTCQVNGLCYLASQQYYGRYTCTDKSWKSPGCPAICTHNNTANGNEAILECSPGSFCCDAFRPELSGGQACCDSSPVRFSIDGNVALTVMSDAPSSATSTALSTTSSLNQSGHTTSVPLSTQPPSSVSSTSSPSPTSVIVVTSVINGKETVTTIPSNNDNGSHTNLGAVIGGAVAGVVALLAIIALAFLLLRQRRRRNPPHIYRNFSLKENLDQMYRGRGSLKTLFQPDTPSELIGSVPDLNAELNEKAWEKRYESPGDVGNATLLAPQRSARDLRQVSPLSQNFPRKSDDSIEPVELPTQENVAHEMPERSNTRKMP